MLDVRYSYANPGKVLLPLFPVLFILSLGLSPVTRAEPWMALDELVFMPAALAENQDQPGRTSLIDSVYANLLTRNTALAFAGETSGENGRVKVHDYENRILAIEEAAGPFATELAEVLHSLGDEYRALGMMEEALASYEREEYINRVHSGLYSETLVPAVKAQISVLAASGQMERADDKQEYLIYLLQRAYGRDDPRLLPELVAYGEWHMGRFNQVVRYEMSEMPMLAFGSGVSTEEAYRLKAFDNLDVAVQQYARAVVTLVNNQQFGDPLLYQMENRLIEAAFIKANRRKVVSRPDEYVYDLDLREDMYRSGPEARLTRDAYHYGIKSYERQLAYITQDPQGSLGRYVETLLAYGDWHVLFGKPGPGYAMYEKARDLLAQVDLPPDAIARVLTPAVPVAMPTFTATPHSVQSVEQRAGVLNPHRGWIDVSFRLNRNGNARDIEILAASDDTPGTVEKRLARTLMKTRFRRRFDGAKLAESDTVSLRYYYTY